MTVCSNTSVRYCVAIMWQLMTVPVYGRASKYGAVVPKYDSDDVLPRLA